MKSLVTVEERFFIPHYLVAPLHPTATTNAIEELLVATLAFLTPVMAMPSLAPNAHI